MRKTLVISAISAVWLAATPARGQQAGGVPATQHEQDKAEANDKFTFAGDAALWTVAIRADKTADFEQVLTRLRQALLASDNPERRQQARGWTVLRLASPLPDGTVAYVHDVRPVVPGADYSVMRILYEAFPDERQALYELYRGAFVKNVALATAAIAIDMGGDTAAPAPATAPLATPPAAPPSTPPAAPTTTTPPAATPQPPAR